MSITRFSTGVARDNLLAGNVSFAASDMELIGTVRVGSGGSTGVTFSNIPQEYKHLQIRGFALGSSANTDYLIRFNDVSSINNYSWHEFRGNGTTASVGAGSNQSYMFLASNAGDANYPTVFIIDILDYSLSSKSKTIKVLEGNDRNGTGTLSFWGGMYFGANTPVSKVLLYPGGGNFNQHSRFSLYGIRG